MKDEYLIKILTDKNLGTSPFVEGLMHTWCETIDERLRPERFGLGEPVRRKFDEYGIQNAIDLWLDNKLPLMLTRKTKPKFTVDMTWREEKGLDPRSYPWRCTVWLAFSAGDDLAMTLLKFLIDHFEPVYGFITTWQNYRDHHFFSYKTEWGTSEEMIGNEVTDTFPSLFWVTYFNQWAIEKLGIEKINKTPTFSKESLDHGILLKLFENSKDIGSQTDEAATSSALETLGRHMFFDRDIFDLDAYIEERYKKRRQRMKQQ